LPKVYLTAAACLALGMLPPTPEPDFTDWSTPENLGPVVNSSSTDAGGSVSKDGLSLYFHSNRSGNNDIYVSQRGDRNAPWGPPVNLGATVNSTAGDAEATLSRDEHWLFFNSARDGGFGNLDIWVSYREHTHDDFDWQPPVNVGSGVNSIAVDTGAAYFENDDTGAPQLLFSSNRLGGPGPLDLYVSELLPDGTFGPAVLIAEQRVLGARSFDSVRRARGVLLLWPAAFSGRARPLVGDPQISARSLVGAGESRIDRQYHRQRRAASHRPGSRDAVLRVKPRGRRGRNGPVRDDAVEGETLVE